MTLARLAITAALLASAACVPRPQPAPEPVPPARPQARPAPAPAPAPTGDWLQAAIGPGTWSYSAGPAGTLATWGAAREGARFAIACDRASRSIRLTRAGAAAGPLEVRTTNGARTLAAAADPGLPGATASLPASDDFLNQLVFSRGRFLVAAAGVEPLIVPTWAEPFRVVEDCRG